MLSEGRPAKLDANGKMESYAFDVAQESSLLVGCEPDSFKRG